MKKQLLLVGDLLSSLPSSSFCWSLDLKPGLLLGIWRYSPVFTKISERTNCIHLEFVAQISSIFIRHNSRPRLFTGQCLGNMIQTTLPTLLSLKTCYTSLGTPNHSVWIIFPAGTHFCFIELVHNLTAMWNEDTTAIPGTALFNCSLLQRLKLTAWECFKD